MMYLRKTSKKRARKKRWTAGSHRIREVMGEAGVLILKLSSMDSS
jgi:hypothetical protein